MAAAEVTPSAIQKEYLHAPGSRGTPLKFIKYRIKVTKVTASDWIVAATHCSGTFLGVIDAYTIVAAGNGVQETTTYTAAGTLLTLTSVSVGTTYLTLLYSVT